MYKIILWMNRDKCLRSKVIHKDFWNSFKMAGSVRNVCNCLDDEGTVQMAKLLIRFVPSTTDDVHSKYASPMSKPGKKKKSQEANKHDNDDPSSAS